MDSSASSLQDSKQGELKEKIARTMPRVVCGECPYRKTLDNCNDGTICQWQKEYAEAIEKVVRQVLVPYLK